MPDTNINSEHLMPDITAMEAVAGDASADNPQEILRAQLRRIMADEGLTQGAIAREAGIHPNTFSAWAIGKYAGRNEPIGEKFARWVASRTARERTQAVMPTAPGFIATRLSQDVFRMLEHAQFLPDLSVFAGDAGLGKTTAISAYAAQAPNVFVITCDPSMSTVRALMEALSDALGLSSRGLSGRRIMQAIVAKLRDTGALLVLDEAQFLSSSALDQLRTVHDLAGVGVTLVGNVQVYTRFEGSERTAQYAQLFSRVGARTTRSRPIAADIAALLDAWGIAGAAERRLLSVIAGKPGTFRGLTKCLRMAHMLAASDGGAVVSRHILAAWEQLGNANPEKGAAA